MIKLEPASQSSVWSSVRELGVTLSGIRGGLSCLWDTVGKFQRRSFSRSRWRASAFLTRDVTRIDSEIRHQQVREVARDAMTLSDLSPDLKTPSTYVSRRYLKWSLTKQLTDQRAVRLIFHINF